MPRTAYATVEAEFLTTNHRSEGETYYSYDTETGQVGTVVSYDHSAYAGVDLKKDAPDYSNPPSSWTTSTTVGGHWDWPIGKRVYKKWILVVNNISGEVRQYMVYTG